MEQFSGVTILLWNKLPENERYNLVRSIQNQEAAQRVWQKDWSSLSESERGFVSRAMTNKDILVRALTGDIVSSDEYPTDKVKASFVHISHSPGDAAYLHRNSFLEAVQSEYDNALPFAETEKQKQILKAEIDRFKQEYIAKENQSMAVRSSTYSAHIAGGSKFNTNQASQRNNALDRSQSGFSSWLSSQSGCVKNAVLAGRNQSQLDSIAKAKAEKAAKQKAGMLEMLGRIIAFKRGDQVKFGSYQIAKVSFGKDGYPTSVTLDATDLTDNKFDIARIFFGGDKAKLRSLVDEIRIDLSKKEAQRFDRELDYLDFAIKETYANDEFWKVILDSTASAGPFDGGCLICAKAIVAAAGRGEIVRIVSDLNDRQTEHYGVRICSSIFDFGGRHESPDAWIKWLAEEEGITDRTLSFAEGMGPESPESCIVSDRAAENAIAGMIRGVRLEAEHEDRLPEKKKIVMAGPRG